MTCVRPAELWFEQPTCVTEQLPGQSTVAVTHLPRAAGLEALVRTDNIANIVATDSVGISIHPRGASGSDAKLTILPVAPLFGQVISRMEAGKPLAPLFSRWPVAPED